MFVATLSLAVHGQAPGVLRIRAVLTDAAREAVPVPRHVLLVSDNPATGLPKRVVTGLDGTARLQLRPGTYTVESERPVALGGNAYTWTLMVEVVAGGEVTLDLTAANADVEAASAAATSPSSEPADDPSFLLPRWQGSIVGVWSPTSRGSGFLVDQRGLVATGASGVAGESSVEVQLPSGVKVAARILEANPERGVAIVWLDPGVVASVPPIPMPCPPAGAPALAEGQDVFALLSPLQGPTVLASGTVSRVDPHAFLSDVRITDGSAGGPLFAADGRVVGVTSGVEDTDDELRGDARAARLHAACDVFAAAQRALPSAEPPSPVRLPVEPDRPFPAEALAAAASGGAPDLTSYRMSSSEFDVTFLTPVLLHAAQHQPRRTVSRADRDDLRALEGELERERLLSDFGGWSAYVDRRPPVLLVRITPKLVEGFWTKVGRGAAQTQGVSLPPFRHVKAALVRMTTLCGDREITPIHRFRLDSQTGGRDLPEGLYVFGPHDLAPECGTVKLLLFSGKQPDKPDTRPVDPALLQQIQRDFASYPPAAR
jgi:S1-C subfamily serine protease